jgi:putative transposase
MMYENLKHLSHSVGQNAFHLVWRPKWNWDPFKFDPVRRLCEAAIRDAARRAGMQILSLEVMPDHVHCFVDLPSTLSVADALQRLKGYSAYLIFLNHPWLRRYFRTGHFWSPGKFFRSVGNVTMQAVQHYIEQTNREARHQVSLTRYPAL